MMGSRRTAVSGLILADAVECKWDRSKYKSMLHSTDGATYLLNAVFCELRDGYSTAMMQQLGLQQLSERQMQVTVYWDKASCICLCSMEVRGQGQSVSQYVKFRTHTL